MNSMSGKQLAKLLEKNGWILLRGLRDSQDTEIFADARTANAVIMTEDSDFVDLVTRLGIPPQILWVTCGNVTNRNLSQILIQTFPNALRLLQEGESIVEISG